jgi:hypothetical protein
MAHYFEDIQVCDLAHYNSQLTKMEYISLMCLDFTATEESKGVRTMELVAKWRHEGGYE